MNSLSYIELKQKSDNYSPADLVNELGFKKGINLARCMLINEEWDESLQEYATHILEELRKSYSKEWDSDWKYDAFIGYAYDIVLNYDKRYIFYKNAFDKVYPCPPELLVALASCCWAPGKPPITEEDAILLVKQAIQTTPYIEAIGLLKGLYKSIGNVKEQRYYEKILKNIKHTGAGIHLPSLDQI